jgi:hypothetical protein
VAHVTDWTALVNDAEAHGLEPLLFAHARECSLSLPAGTATRLKARCVQHAHEAAVRTRAIETVLDALEATGIPALVLKGAALAHLVYPFPFLRPMRDVDLLVPADQADCAWRRLVADGFSPAGAPLASRHHHLQAITTSLDGVTVFVEIHKRLLGAIPFVAPMGYDQVAARAQTFTWGARQARTLGREDMLWHVYAHAFALDALRPEVRLISVADLVAALAAWGDGLDWRRLQRQYPRLVRALPHIGQIGAATGCGTLSQRLRRNALSPRIWWPLPWWFDVRYGVDGPVRRCWHRAITHPATVVLSALDVAWWKHSNRHML